MSALRDPHEIAKCACPRLDGRECARVRSGRHLMDDLEHWASYDSDDECGCACHVIYEDQLRDQDQDEEWAAEVSLQAAPTPASSAPEPENKALRRKPT